MTQEKYPQGFVVRDTVVYEGQPVEVTTIKGEIYRGVAVGVFKHRGVPAFGIDDEGGLRVAFAEIFIASITQRYQRYH